MFDSSHVFSGFSVNDLEAAKQFYGQTLGMTVEQNPQGLSLKMSNGGQIFVYPKPDHLPATFTILNFVVGNIDSAAEELAAKGIKFEQYADMTDDKGVARGLSSGRGPDIAWFKDPAGNILSVLQDH